MTRVKRGVAAHKKREAILKQTKGFKWGRKSKESLAKQALIHAYSHAFQGRKQKKRDYRSMWLVQINAALRLEGLTYSKFIGALKKANIIIDRKILSGMANTRPEAFKAVLEAVK